MFEKEAEEYRKDLKSKFFLSEPQLDLACQGFKDGYNKANEWHYPSKGEYPECDENKKLWLYFKDYYANDRDCEHPIYRTSTGVYKTSFLNEDVKLFVEKSKGYEDEHLPKDVIAWKEIVLPKESE